ncbi:PepSY-like domain-containing protein [Pareuzebyella sediminis]|uniref:PepSY-like domain-containing protein n=1 Tax=Pareuzebyella sediminis TaxID=2607998 RepID=UPI001E455289|nr:PepSY-like domain-containing protein [Pareuzebyella sediminis]
MMKKIKILGAVLFAATIGSSIYAFGTSEDAPQKVKDSFAQKFPSVKKVKWDKENETEWEAEFKMKGTEYSANFLEDGTWQETEHEIKKNAIPAKVKTTLDTEFTGYKIEEAELSETVKGSVYEFELEKGKEKIEVNMDSNGKVVDNKMSKDVYKDDKD